jgi:Predicted membrane protein (DUF2231)
MEINGLPLHPLIVHAVVILGPLAGLTGLAYALVPKWRWLLRWPLVALAVIVAVTAFVAKLAGDSLLEARPELEPLVSDHMNYGNLLRNWALTFVVDAVLAAWALGGTSALASGRGAQESRGLIGWIAMLLLVAGSIGLMVLLFLTGDSGARAVWG